jgi:predicted RNA binding protein YcfA (HicA-like mRNA interferase family)
MSMRIIKSSDLIKELKADGWTLDRVRGSHHVFKHPVKAGHVTVPAPPKKDLGKGLVAASRTKAVYKEMTMRYPIVIEAGNDATTFGVVVPDLLGCFSAGDTLDASH